jgi:hypothetical protein
MAGEHTGVGICWPVGFWVGVASPGAASPTGARAQVKGRDRDLAESPFILRQTD